MPRVIKLEKGFVYCRTKKEVALMIETFRGKFGETKKEFSSRIGVSEQYYQNLLSGISYPGWTIIQALGSLGFDINQLWNLTKEEIENFNKN